MIESELFDQGCEIADLVLSQYKTQSTLRLYVYSKRGATMEEIGKISRIVGGLIDGSDLFEKGYTLEVSSTGLDWPLKTDMDFRYRIGETVRIQFAAPGRKKITAMIVGVADGKVDFKNDDGPFTVDLEEMEQAKIVF